MKINANGHLAKFAFGDATPYRTDLCELFWSVVTHFAVLGVIGTGIGVYLSLWVTMPLEMVVGHGGAALAAGACFFIGWITEEVHPIRRVQHKVKASSWYQFLKGNYCPSIEVIHADDSTDIDYGTDF